MAQTIEVLQRGWYVKGDAVRPDHRMVAHTGFLTTARLLGERFVNQLDLIVALTVGAAALGGWRLGFLARVFSWSVSASACSSPAACCPTALQRVVEQRHGVPGRGRSTGPARRRVRGPSGRPHGRPAYPRGLAASGRFAWSTAASARALGAAGVLLSFWLFVLPWLVDLPGWPAQQARSSRCRPGHRPVRARRRPTGSRRCVASSAIATSPGCSTSSVRRPRRGRRRRRPASPPGVQERVAASTVKDRRRGVPAHPGGQRLRGRDPTWWPPTRTSWPA